MLQRKCFNSLFKLSTSYSSRFTFGGVKRFSSQVYGNIVKQSEDLSICTRELLIPFEGKNSVIYFDKEETIESMQEKIKACDTKVQKVVFQEMNKAKAIDPKKKLVTILDAPFEINLNNNDKIKYLPSLNLIAQNKLGFTSSNTGINNSLNFFIYSYITCPKIQKQNLSDYKKTLDDLVDSYQMIYKKLLAEQSVTSNLIEKRINKSEKIGSLVFILLVLAHIIVFYTLIYQLYGWDEIEPFTYIVGNVYWILGLSFFIFAKNRIDVSFFSSQAFRSRIFEKQCKKLSFKPIEKEFVEKHIENLNYLKESISKI